MPGPQTNIRAELMGVVVALAIIAKRGEAGARIRCDCKLVVDVARGLARRLSNLDLWACFDVELGRAHIPPNAIEWTQAHVGTIGNELADMAARAEAQRLIDSRARLYLDHERTPQDTRADGRNESRQDEVPPPKRRRYDPAMDGWEDE